MSRFTSTSRAHFPTAAALLLLLAAQAGLALGVTTRVNVAGDGSQTQGDVLTGQSYSSRRSMSDDGRYVVFISAAANLVPGDTNQANDVFVHDRQNGVTVRASVADNGAEAASIPGTIVLNTHATISGNGRYVAFYSLASNLAPNDTNGNASDLFVRDLQEGRTVLASVGVNGVSGDLPSPPFPPPHPHSPPPSISQDGALVCFESQSKNLVAADPDESAMDVFVRDLSRGQTELVSLAPGGGHFGRNCSQPMMSRSGRFVVFYVEGAGQETPGLYLRDRQLGTTVLVIEAQLPDAIHPMVSDDGRFVVFRTGVALVAEDTNNSTDLYVRDMQQNTLDRVQSGRGFSQFVESTFDITADGRLLALPTLDNQVLVLNHVAGLGGAVVSRSGSGELANDWVSFPGITADGRYVSFTTIASNLVAGDTNGLTDVFVNDGPNRDLFPPGISNARVTPATLPQQGGTVTLSVDGLDDRGVVAARVRIVPSTDGTNPHQDVSLALAAGTAQNGTWRGTLQLPANTTGSDRTYQVYFTVYDADSESLTLGPVTLTHSNVPADVLAPEVTSPDADPQNLGSGGGPVRLTVVAADDRGVASVTAEITKPDGGKESVSLQRESGTDQSGGYGGTFTMPANTGARAQTYRIAFLAVDAAGNEGRSSQSVQVKVAAGGRLTVAPGSVNFGSLRVNTAARRTLLIRNTGTGPLEVTVGTLRTPFAMVSGGGSFTLQPGQSRKGVVQFRPTRRQTRPPFTARLTIRSSGTPSLVPVTLTGTSR